MTRGLYKRGNIYWLRYVGLDGKIVFESSGSTKYKVAEALLVKRRKAIQEGSQPELKRIENHTFNELATEYEKWMARQRSFVSKKCNLDQLKEAFGNVPLRRFNTMMLEQFQTQRLQQGRKTIKDQPVGNAPATINRLTALLKHMFTKASDWNMVEEDVVKRVHKVKLLEENNRRLRYLSVEECRTLIDNCADHLKPIVITALHTGLRKSNVLSLKWANVDLVHGFIHVDITKNGSMHEVPIDLTLRATLEALPRALEIPYVFHDPITGKPYGDIKNSFTGACKRAGITDFHFHDLRHTFASHLIMAGADITTVSRLLAHRDLTMTMRYSHLSPLHMTSAVNLLDATLNKVPADFAKYTKTIQSGEFENLEGVLCA